MRLLFIDSDLSATLRLCLDRIAGARYHRAGEVAQVVYGCHVSRDGRTQAATGYAASM